MHDLLLEKRAQHSRHHFALSIHILSNWRSAVSGMLSPSPHSIRDFKSITCVFIGAWH